MLRFQTILRQAVLAAFWFGVACLVGPPRWSAFCRLSAVGRGNAMSSTGNR